MREYYVRLSRDASEKLLQTLTTNDPEYINLRNKYLEDIKNEMTIEEKDGMVIIDIPQLDFSDICQSPKNAFDVPIYANHENVGKYVTQDVGIHFNKKGADKINVDDMKWNNFADDITEKQIRVRSKYIIDRKDYKLNNGMFEDIAA